MINKISDFCRQYQYLQLEKPSGVEVEIPVHKTMARDLLKGGSYRTPPGSDRVNQNLKTLIFTFAPPLEQCAMGVESW